MDSARKPCDLKSLIEKLRSVTLAVQILPFVYGILFVGSLVVYVTCPEDVCRLCDTFLYVSPLMVCSFLYLSRVLRLCAWHRRACCVPLIPQAVTLVDYYVIELTDVAMFVNYAICAVAVIILLVAAYNIFLS